MRNLNEVNAKILIAELYRKSINKFITEAYVDAYKFLYQYDKVVRTTTVILSLNLRLHYRRSMARTTTPESKFLQRMDRYRYGVSVDAEDRLRG